MDDRGSRQGIDPHGAPPEGPFDCYELVERATGRVPSPPSLRNYLAVQMMAAHIEMQCDPVDLAGKCYRFADDLLSALSGR